MGYSTKVQLIRRKTSEQWYVNFPAALAGAMEFQKAETVEWIVEDKDTLILRRSGEGRAGAKSGDKKKRNR